MDGYKVHLNDICDEDRPHLMSDVQTTPAPVADFDMPPKIWSDLAAAPPAMPYCAEMLGGCDAYVPEPLNITDLRQTVLAFLSGRQSVRHEAA